MRNFFILLLLLSSTAKATGVDSLKQVRAGNVNDEKLVLEYFSDGKDEQHYRLIDSIAPFYLKNDGLSDSFYAQVKNLYARSGLMLRLPYKVLINRFRRALADTAHLTSNLDKGMICHTMGALYYNYGYVDSTKLQYEKALHYYGKRKNEYRMYQVYINLALVYRAEGDLALALKTLTSIRNEVKEALNSHQMISYYGTLSTVYADLSIQDSAAFYVVKAIDAAQKNQDYELMGHYSINLSNLFSNAYRLDEALVQAERGSRYLKKSGDLRKMQYAHIAKARAFRGLEIIDSAIWYNKLAIQDANGMGNSIALGNLGNCFLAIDEYDSCIMYANKSLEIKRRLKTNKGKAACFLDVAEAMAQLQNYTVAKWNLDSALIQLKIYNEFRLYQNYYDQLTEYYLRTNNEKEVLKAIELKENYTDSLYGNERDARVDGLRILYESEQQELKIQSLNQDNLIKNLQLQQQQSESRIQFLVIIIAVVLLVLMVIGFFVQKRFSARLKLLNNELTDKNQIIESKNNQLDIVNKEIYHRTKNHMQTMASVLGLQKDKLADGKTKDVLAENELRLNAMGLIHKKLFKQDPFAQIGLNEFVEELIKDLAFAFNVSQGFSYKIELSEVNIKPDALIPLSLALNECFTNSFKYAFAMHETPQLTVEGQMDSGMYCIDIRDNGPGFKNLDEMDQSASFGLELIRNMALQLEGSATYQNENGAHTTFKFRA